MTQAKRSGKEAKILMKTGVLETKCVVGQQQGT